MTIETKFNIGQEVWLMWYNKPISTQIKEIRTTTQKCSKFCIKTFEETTIGYVIEEDFAFISEDKLFPTKEELLKSL